MFLQVTSMSHPNWLTDSCRINFYLQGGGMSRSSGYGD